GLSAEAAQFLILRLVLVHPLYRLVIPRAGVFLLAKLPVGHRQEEEVFAVAALAESYRFAQGGDGGFPVAHAVVGHAQGIPVAPVGRPPGSISVNQRLGQSDCLAWVAQLLIRASGQEPGGVVLSRRVWWHLSPLTALTVRIGRAQPDSLPVVQGRFTELV